MKLVTSTRLFLSFIFCCWILFIGISQFVAKFESCHSYCTSEMQYVIRWVRGVMVSDAGYESAGSNHSVYHTLSMLTLVKSTDDITVYLARMGSTIAPPPCELIHNNKRMCYNLFYCLFCYSGCSCNVIQYLWNILSIPYLTFHM